METEGSITSIKLYPSQGWSSDLNPAGFCLLLILCTVFFLPDWLQYGNPGPHSSDPVDEKAKDHSIFT